MAKVVEGFVAESRASLQQTWLFERSFMLIWLLRLAIVKYRI
jgi:hypothetical protein